ncbi:CorA family divalent cation transporter [Photobacterium sp. DNB23_23_1]|uniref:Zinc transporter ZntB n=1 Tax=Photobacterium pectinilyticum TaxID=2906793 RepID=A0ABT1N2D6_9GAMM|nr:CorA family divalent cation transporter [Photobacterium sp. ZSDE20]MCQ1058034.1 zinc transporter ZntB [Photobacterium sp. ZSDE20]MDD1822567.1 zinc transporter ZntB [Photobacterium sp. ZSDE20]
MNGFIISCWDFTSGVAIESSLEANKLLPANWYHCQRDAEGLRSWLLDNLIPEAIVDSLLTDDTRPRFEKYSDDCFLIILRGINLNEGSEPDDMLSLRILWYKGSLISTRKVPSRAVANIVRKLEQGEGPNTLTDLLQAIANSVNSIISDFLSPVEDRLNEMDENVHTDRAVLSSINSRLLRLRRYLKPQRYVLEDLIEADIPVLKGYKNHFKNCLDTIMRMNESIDFYIDQINLYFATINQQQAETMNRNTYLFSVIAGIFLPAGFFTGLLGVNIGGIPGVENPLAFTLFCLGLIVIVAVEVIVLKKLRYI